MPIFTNKQPIKVVRQPQEGPVCALVPLAYAHLPGDAADLYEVEFQLIIPWVLTMYLTAVLSKSANRRALDNVNRLITIEPGTAARMLELLELRLDEALKTAQQAGTDIKKD